MVRKDLSSRMDVSRSESEHRLMGESDQVDGLLPALTALGLDQRSPLVLIGRFRSS